MNLSGVMLLLVEAYSAQTGRYMVLGGFRTTATLQVALSKMDDQNQRAIRVSILNTEDIEWPTDRAHYYTAAEVLKW